ncbi:prolyl oligopeptidase family serine peptidase [Sunxiuqinia sp. sy24]|uniref:prolyl oligopeptidase family serine peptidase n=1 Tax=Sunxiuqinia sp. sy24 TaxID=3461495 RepID=UPI0040463355
MKQTGFLLILMMFAQYVLGQNSVALKNWELATLPQVQLPAFADVPNVDGNKFEKSDLLKQLQPSFDRADYQWETIELANDSLIQKTSAKELVLLSGYLSVDRWTKGSLTISLNAVAEIYVDGDLQKTQQEDKLADNKIELKLQAGKHEVMLKVIAPAEPLKLDAEFVADEEFENTQVDWSLSADRFLTIHDVLDGEDISSASVSPSGKYVLISYSEVVRGSGKSKSWKEVYDLEQKKNVLVLRNAGISQIKWLPVSDRLSYILRFEEKAELFVYDLLSGLEKSVAQNMDDFSGYRWAETEDFVIYTRSVKADKPGDLKRIFGNDDRLPYFRSRSYLNKIDVATGTIFPLTAGNLTSSLHDIHFDGTKILFSTRKMDYAEVPFSKQNLFEMDLASLELDTIWKDKLYGGSCQYSPDGKYLLVQGGPECFGDLGVNVSDDRIPNSYDSQLFLYNLQSGEVDPITRKFNPAVAGAHWGSNDRIYISAVEKSYKFLYTYDLAGKKYQKIDLPVDVLGSIDYAHKKPVAVFTGSSQTTPEQLYVLNLKKEDSKLLRFPKEKQLADVQFGQTTDWNFTNKKGTTIYGRVYYPPNYDADKKYPVIVNFYGGTSPTSRTFGGRYPKNIWAAAGYLVYVMQPSGATGFGQDFSALHVNGWGAEAIDDIIEGTEKFLAAHPDADSENVGCIGASYGGFTTMLLQTRTSLFKTAISHAGISSITSYWGEGYWGYSYNAGAAKNSYPWSRKDIFVENSPLYNADKFSNSILLLHGTADTNVPVGESLQYYAALKLLGKDVEMVLVDGEDHWIIDYNKRLKWHQTIMSWFDLRLKNQAQQWEDLYPDKNL